MSIDEGAVFTAVLVKLATLGYTTSEDELTLPDYVRFDKPLGSITFGSTTRETLDHAQTGDTTDFTLQLWREPGQRTEIIQDIQDLIGLMEADTTLGGLVDLCQVLDAVQVNGQDVDGVLTYWTLDIRAEFES